MEMKSICIRILILLKVFAPGLDSIWLLLWIMQEYRAAVVCRDFTITPLQPKVFQLELSKWQDMFISTKAGPGILSASFGKIRWSLSEEKYKENNITSKYCHCT